ncbi:uncharacterized protein, YigZ family [Desulfocicer vacuolatum DSM 3385]|uniref:Uncharacterized protein, YigZ family n=1 Tax=Desulfocicer vacuolatum DSM 3385 TaxID=1121400 RepID=A0A1W2C0Z9_9BACT|nr:YigZ family protein [Desulfocicer vacuolatum]SMC78907.1 uncharacterized protein, YigZ family [Desulfocicer vacuolatum DSM 3385]
MEYFYSVKTPRSREIKIKRSTFICALCRVDSMEEAKTFISSVASEHKTATHNCWAYIVGDKGETFHCSDNGEPAGTAGKPMLNVLQSHHMTRIVAVVTRYFGGVKLGIRGLIEAYGEAVESAIALEKLMKLVKINSYRVTLPYAFNDTLLYQLNNLGVVIAETDYTEQVTHGVAVEAHDAPVLEKMLTEYQDGGKLTFEGPLDPEAQEC